MRTKTKFICDLCNREIEPKQGKIVRGQIFMIEEDTKERKKLAGVDNEDYFEKKYFEVAEYAYCDECFKGLCEKPKPILRENDFYNDLYNPKTL